MKAEIKLTAILLLIFSLFLFVLYLLFLDLYYTVCPLYILLDLSTGVLVSPWNMLTKMPHL